MKTEMTDDELRVRVAELMVISPIWSTALPTRHVHCDVPDFPRDLNAIGGAIRCTPRFDLDLFATHLYWIIIPADMHHADHAITWNIASLLIIANARQRCIAFVRTMEGAR